MALGLYSLLATRIISDKSTNQFSAIDILESAEIDAPLQRGKNGLATLKLSNPFYVLTVVGREADDEPCVLRCSLRIHTPSGKIVKADQEVLVDLTKSRIHRSVGSLEQMPVENEGFYTFELYDDEKEESIISSSIYFQFRNNE